MPYISVVMPVYNVERFVEQAIASVLAQTYTDFELIIVNDCSTDNSVACCQRFEDSRIRIVSHDQNSGLAAARNTGIRESEGCLIAFLDSDDAWHPEKLAKHVSHFESNPNIGLSFSRSAFMGEDGTLTDCFQMPKLVDISAEYMFQRNPVGNGSAPVLRREALADIAFNAMHNGLDEVQFFDARLRRSEDIECWTRLMLKTVWQVEGIPEPLTYYRLNSGGLSASLAAQFHSWQMVRFKIRTYAPAFVEAVGNRAMAYQLRYLARQAIRMRLNTDALPYCLKAIRTDIRIVFSEPMRTANTLAASLLITVSPEGYSRLERFATRVIGRWQLLVISRQSMQR